MYLSYLLIFLIYVFYLKINSIILQKTLKTLIIEHSVLKNPHISSFLFNIDFVCPDLEVCSRVCMI